MKHKKSVMTVLILAMLGLSGCAENQIPDVSEEEMRAIGEYVAYTMVKYDVGHGSRLMDLPPVEEMDEQAPVPTRSPEETVGMDPVDDTPVVDASGEVVTDEGQSMEEPSYSAEEVMGLPEGVALSFAGKSCWCSSSPSRIPWSRRRVWICFPPRRHTGFRWTEDGPGGRFRRCCPMTWPSMRTPCRREPALRRY